MPVYEYFCGDCGPFTRMRPMAECDLPSDCPACGVSAPRVILTAPHFSTMPAATRQAHTVNERGAHAPRSHSSDKSSHGAGCPCCSGKSTGMARRGKDGSKSFPASRPWMISH
ncbi:MAG: zinc ribbon domain-containing protein [Bradyrhizobiaceae bacterium]|nr:zinc ribbon domain-containing protein [Bradyrhizobiaceae bacterium]